MDKMKKTEATRYGFKIFNGRVKVYVNDYVMFTFNQIDFKGYYAYKDDTLLYGLDIYLMNEKGGATTMEIYFKTKENWLLLNLYARLSLPPSTAVKHFGEAGSTCL